MSVAVLPLAITMVAGPQLMSAIILLTSSKPIRNSLAFLAGFTVAASVGVTLTRALGALLGSIVALDKSSGSVGTVIQIGLVLLLAVAALRNYVRREKVEPPRWLGALQSAGPRKAFVAALLLVAFMPTDIIAMLTVGANLEQNDASVLEAWPFLLTTTVLISLPLFLYLLAGSRARRGMPRARDWMNAHAWLVNVVVCVIFIVLVV